MTRFYQGSIEFTAAALENIEESGLADSVEDDVQKIRDGRLIRESLLLACLDGAEDDRVQGWRDYVAAVCATA
jgi:hypothetical protein